MKKLLVLSGKGGTGKTTVALAMISLSHAKAFADCDVDAPNLHLLKQFDTKPEQFDFYGGDKAYIDNVTCEQCGRCQKVCRFDAIEKKATGYTISEYACEGCGVCEYVCPAHAVSMIPDKAGKVDLFCDSSVFATAELKMGRGNSGKLVSEVKSALFDHAENIPFAVLDGSPGIGCPVMASISGVDYVLIVTEPTKSGFSDLQRIATTVRRSCVKAAVCINKYDLNTDMSEIIKDWCRQNALPFVGCIPYDKSASEAINKNVNLVELDTPAAVALKAVYHQVVSLLGGIQ